MKKITGEHLLWIGCGAGFAGFLVSLILMASVQEGSSLWLFGVGSMEIACGVLYIGTAVLMICFAWIGCLSVERWWARVMILVLLVASRNVEYELEQEALQAQEQVAGGHVFP